MLSSMLDKDLPSHPLQPHTHRLKQQLVLRSVYHRPGAKRVLTVKNNMQRGGIFVLEN